MAFHWRTDNGPTLNAGFGIVQGIRTSISKKPLFCDFSGGPDPLFPSGAAHADRQSRTRERERERERERRERRKRRESKDKSKKEINFNLYKEIYLTASAHL